MPAVLVTGPTVMQNSTFSSLAVAVTIAGTHFAYPWRDDQAELAWMAWLNTKTVYPRNGHPPQYKSTKNCSCNDCNDTRCWLLQNIL